MSGIDVTQEGLLFGELLVAVAAENGFQLKMYGAKMSVEVTWGQEKEWLW